MESFTISLILIVLIQMHGSKGCLEKERTGLLEIKSFFISISHTDVILTSWVDDDPMSDCCGWERVKCSATTGRVIELSLNSTTRQFYSAGAPLLNSSLFHPFEELQSLDLSVNYFQGFYENKAYDSLGSLKQLKILNLSFNGFNDCILPYLNTLTSLTTLILIFNKIKGLANLRNLQVLDLTANSNMTSASLTTLGLANLKNLTRLKLHNCGIRITTVQGLGNLTNLQVLDLSGNTMSISVRGLGLAKLRNLEALDLSSNNISGSLESQGICELKNLIELNLMENNFEGYLPQCLYNLTRLKVLDISSNQLSGNLPSVIANLTSLKYLALSDNNFQGIFSLNSLANHSMLEFLLLSNINKNLRLEVEKHWIPTFQLKVLQLSNCYLKTIPGFLLHQYELKFLDLSDNKLVGSFPTWLLQNNSKLQVLRLTNNSLSGNLQLPKVKHDLLRLDISTNNFTGKLPHNIGIILQKLLGMKSSKNNFVGNIPSSIGEMKELSLLDLSRNYHLEGNIPIQLNNLKALDVLDLSQNRLSGSLTYYFNLPSVKHLYLQNNALSGFIPGALFRSTKLKTLDLRNNKFSGGIPRQINESSNLSVLLLGGNNLEGHIPNQLCQFGKLSILDLSLNRLNGSIPSCFGNVLFWRVGTDGTQLEYDTGLSFDSIGNYFNFSLNLMLYVGSYTKDQEVVEFVTKNRYEFYHCGHIYYMTGLDLSFNKLTGQIPSEIGQLGIIRGLNLSHNSLSGTIPESFSNLKMIESLDLSHNKLSDQIPPQLTALNFLSTFNVSYNNLSGPTPDKGQFGTFVESSYRGNPHLCGSLINKKCNITSTPAGGGEDESAIDMVALYWSFGASYVTVISGLFAILRINSHWRRLWFYFIDECIDTCYYWLFKYVFYR